MRERVVMSVDGVRFGQSCVASKEAFDKACASIGPDDFSLETRPKELRETQLRRFQDYLLGLLVRGEVKDATQFESVLEATQREIVRRMTPEISPRLAELLERHAA